MTQEIQKWLSPKTQITRRHSWRLYLRINICRLYGSMKKFGGYSIGIAQIDDEEEEKLSFRICPNSPVSLLVTRSDMPDMRCFSLGGLKNQHDAVLESFGTTEKLIFSLTRLPSTTYCLLSSSPQLLKKWNFPLFLLFSSFENILSQTLTWRRNSFYRNYSKSRFDLAAKRSSTKIL